MLTDRSYRDTVCLSSAEHTGPTYTVTRDPVCSSNENVVNSPEVTEARKEHHKESANGVYFQVIIVKIRCKISSEGGECNTRQHDWLSSKPICYKSRIELATEKT